MDGMRAGRVGNEGDEGSDWGSWFGAWSAILETFDLTRICPETTDPPSSLAAPVSFGGEGAEDRDATPEREAEAMEETLPLLVLP